MTLVTDAMIFAAEAHDGMLRKGTDIPYIVHPAEVAAIAATLTSDEEILAAAVLHDVMEDCGVTQEELARRFTPRVAQLVASETQKRSGDPRRTWLERKRSAISRLAQSDRSVRIIALSDKLSNMRAIHRDFDRDSDTMFLKFHQHDKRLHAWYYRSCMTLLQAELGQTDAWCELCMHVEHVFSGIPPVAPDEAEAAQAI